MVDALLLEWEGVLADTRVARRDALVRALDAEGLAIGSSAAESCSDGRSPRAAAAAALLLHGGVVDHTLADLVALRAGKLFLATLSGGIMLAPGATAFLEEARRHARIAIATRATRAETDVVLRLAGLDAMVATIVTADDVSGDAPSPALYGHALARLSRVRLASAANTVALADDAVSFHAARAAGIRTVAVGAPAHEALEADAGVASLDGLTFAAVERLVAAIGAEPLA